MARLLDIAGREAFNLAYGREAEPGEWKTMSSADREALVEMGMQNTADAERQRGMPSEDCREAKKQMASKNLLEVKVGGRGSCLFLVVEAAVPGKSAERLREEAVRGMQDDGEVTMEYAQEMIKSETWGTDREIARKEMREAGCDVTIQTKGGSGGSTRAVSVEAEATTQRAGAEGSKGEQHSILQKLGGGADKMGWRSKSEGVLLLRRSKADCRGRGRGTAGGCCSSGNAGSTDGR